MMGINKSNHLYKNNLIKILCSCASITFLSAITYCTGQITLQKVSDEFIFNPPPFAQCHASKIVEVTPEKFMSFAFGGIQEGNKDMCIWLSTK